MKFLKRVLTRKRCKAGKRERESAKGLIKSRKIIKRNIGKVYVRFAEPFSVRDIIQKADDQKVDPKLALQKTAFQLCKSINDVSPITPKSIEAGILLSHREPALPLSEILRMAERMADYVTYSGMSLSTNQKSGFRAAVESTVKSLQKKGYVSVSEGTPRSYSAEFKRRVVLNFYKNNSIHCFVIPAICAMAFLDTVRKRKESNQRNNLFYSDFLQSALTLRNILKFEFFFSPRISFPEELKRTLGFFSNGTDWERASDLEWIGGFHNYFQDWDEATVYAGLLGELLESYQLLMTYLRGCPGEEFDKKGLISKLVRYSENKNQEGDISYPESISIQNFSNGLLSCENKKYILNEKLEEKSLLRVAPWNFETEEMLRDVQRYLSLLNDRPSAIVQ